MWLAIKNVLFTALVPGILAGWLPVYLAGGFGQVRAFGVRQLIASLLLAAGFSTMLAATVFFGTVGRGTAAPFDPPVRLVARGPHRYVRNPMYLGLVVAVVGWALWFESWSLVLYAGAGWLFFHLIVRFYEEPTLQQLFGAEYDAYRARVRRWLPGRPY